MTRLLPKAFTACLLATLTGAAAAQTAARGSTETPVSAVGEDPLLPLDGGIERPEGSPSLRAPGAPANAAPRPADAEAIREMTALVQEMQRRMTLLESRIEALEEKGLRAGSQGSSSVNSDAGYDETGSRRASGGSSGEPTSGGDGSSEYDNMTDAELQRLQEQAEDEEIANAIQRRRDQIQSLQERRQLRDRLDTDDGRFDNDSYGDGYDRGLDPVDRLQLRTEELIDEVQTAEQAEQRQREERQRQQELREAREAAREN